MLKMGTGTKIYYLYAQVTNMGYNRIELKLTDNEGYAKSQTILGKFKADTIEQAKEYFKIVDMTR